MPIADTYQEALICLRAKAFIATALMCRRTVEGVAAHHSIAARSLASALKELKDKGIIEERLFEWAEALRIAGNQAAHDANVAISKQDATDIVDFTDAFLAYVFTFRDKFEERRGRSWAISTKEQA